MKFTIECSTVLSEEEMRQIAFTIWSEHSDLPMHYPDYIYYEVLKPSEVWDNNLTLVVRPGPQTETEHDYARCDQLHVFPWNGETWCPECGTVAITAYDPQTDSEIR